MNEVQTLIELIEKKEKLAAMVAPSFPIVFPYPNIITRLKKLGFSYVVEVAAGAKKTNEQLVAKLNTNPQARYITSPCPTVVRLIRKQMPQYDQYLTHGVDSPMAATAKIIREHYPGYRPIFIGPCIAKKLEANEDVPELNILVLTYIEIQTVFDHFGIADEANPRDKFDISDPSLTRLYPVDGGLSHSSGASKQLQEGEVQIISGCLNCIKAVKHFEINTKVRLLDILNCPGGCIGGPGIKSDLSTEARAKKITDYLDAHYP